MKTLISSSVLNKFRETISDEEYKSGWAKLKAYQAQANLIKTYKETEFQSEFFFQIFDNIFGFITRAKSLKDANLIVEKKIEIGQKFIDGAVIDKQGMSKIVIELKDTKSSNLMKSNGSKAGGLHSLTPMQQTAIYLFHEPLAELAIVTNFDNLIIFDRKEAFRQEFSLFTMSYEEFQEIYLILCSDSFFGGLTALMIRQSESSDEKINDDFYLKVKTLHKQLHNTLKPKYAADLFNKFMAMALFEDSGKLPSNLINTVHGRKDDFDHNSKSHWLVWTSFFQSMKNNKAGREYLGISSAISALQVWQDISYLGRIKVSKSILDLVVDISKYDLWSVSLQELFYHIAINLDSPYDEVMSSDPFEFYSGLLTKGEIGADQAISFITLKTCLQNAPLIDLYNQIASSPIQVFQDGMKFAIAPNSEIDDYWIIKNLVDLDEFETVQLIKQNAKSIQLYETNEGSVVLINLTLFEFGKNASENIPLYINPGSDNAFSMDRNNIKKRIILLSSEDKKWLNERMLGAKEVSDYVTVVSEQNADLRVDLETHSVVKFDVEAGIWELNDDALFANNSFIYLKMKNVDIYYMMKSQEFSKMMDLIDFDKKSFINLPVFKKLTTDKWLTKSKELIELNKNVRVYELRLDKLKYSDSSNELDILKIEATLDALYEKQSEYIGEC